MGGRGKKSLIFVVLLFSVFLLALVGTQNALAVLKNKKKRFRP